MCPDCFSGNVVSNEVDEWVGPISPLWEFSSSNDTECIRNPRNSAACAVEIDGNESITCSAISIEFFCCCDCTNSLDTMLIIFFKAI